MKASVLSIGNELMRGDIVDTNAAFLARELSRIGCTVVRVEAVGDDLQMLQERISSHLRTSDVLVCTGGLGPTADDLTRQAIAGVVGEDPQVDEDLLRILRERFASMGRRMPESNHQQAFLIPSAQAVPNPNGTAPGWIVRHNSRMIAALPGPPSEMKPMWNDSVQPEIEDLLSEKSAMISLLTFGIGESAVEERIRKVIAWRPDVVVATYAKSHAVEVHITARAPDATAAQSLAFEAEQRLRALLGSAIFGSGSDTLAHAVGRLLENRKLSLSVMESCSGGTLASMITDVPGSSQYFNGAIVAYTERTKAQNGVDVNVMQKYGLISAETALAMAQAACRTLHSDIGLGVTGVAGSEPVEDQSPGTVFVAVHSSELNEVRHIRRIGTRDVIKRTAAQSALDLLRLQLLGSMDLPT